MANTRSEAAASVCVYVSSIHSVSIVPKTIHWMQRERRGLQGRDQNNLLSMPGDAAAAFLAEIRD